MTPAEKSDWVILALQRFFSILRALFLLRSALVMCVRDVWCVFSLCDVGSQL